jgi:hypothetical protein
MTRVSSTNERLALIAEQMFPYLDSMCVNCIITQKNHRISFVWRMGKELSVFSQDKVNDTLDELEKAAGIKPAIPTANQQMGE